MYKKQHFNVVLNLVLKPFNLQWNERLGLSYFFKLPYGNIMYNLTKDISDVLTFLGVDPEKYTNDTYSMDNFTEFLTECKYTYLPSIFSYTELPSENLIIFKEALVENIKFVINHSHLPYIHSLEPKFHPFKDTNRFLHLLDKSFNKKGSLIRASAGFNCFTNKQQKAFIKNKFNGKLMVDWIPNLKSITNFGEIKEAFKIHIERETKFLFNSYVKRTSGKEIRKDFIHWYTQIYKELDNEFNNLPL